MTGLRICAASALAAVVLIATFDGGRALDLGDTVRSATRSVSDAVSGGGSGTSASVGSGAGGGLKAGVKSGLLDGTNVDADLLGQSGVASVNAGSKGPTTKGGTSVLSRGQLISLGLDPNASFGAGDAGGISEAFARSLLADLGRIEKQALKLKCRDVLRSPKAFDAELILLCQIVASL
jgi:hypothetical protein